MPKRTETVPAWAGAMGPRTATAATVHTVRTERTLMLFPCLSKGSARRVGRVSWLAARGGLQLRDSAGLSPASPLYTSGIRALRFPGVIWSCGHTIAPSGRDRANRHRWLWLGVQERQQ